MAVHLYTRPRRHINGEGLCYCPGTCLSILFINIIAYYIMNKLPQNTRKDMDIKIRTGRIKVVIWKKEILKGVTVDVYKNKITGFMGPCRKR